MSLSGWTIIDEEWTVDETTGEPVRVITRIRCDLVTLTVEVDTRPFTASFLRAIQSTGDAKGGEQDGMADQPLPGAGGGRPEGEVAGGV